MNVHDNNGITKAVRSSLIGAAFAASAIFAAAGGAVASEDRADGPADCPQIGDTCDDGSVYIGSRILSDRDGIGLGDFYLYAAPRDLTDDQGDRLLLTFNDAVEHLTTLRGFFGHDGGRFESDAALYAAIHKAEYGGEWFIPPKEVLLENLHPNRDAGALRGTFRTEINGSGYAYWYWSASEHPDPALLPGVYIVDLTNGDGGWAYKNLNELPSRVVRAEPRP